MSSPPRNPTFLTIYLDPGDWKRDPEALAQLLELGWKEMAQGGDASSICPSFPSQLITLQAAAREFLSVPIIRSEFTDAAKTTLKPQWLNLLTSMFHRYFQYMQDDFPPDTPPDALVDALLLLSDCPDMAAHSNAPGFKQMVCLLARCVAEVSSSPDSKEGIAVFFAHLNVAWNIEKRFRLSDVATSLMPWSVQSIKEGSLSTTTSANEQAPIDSEFVFMASQCENPLTFPDMVWLGAPHDGHPLHSSLTSYVSARWSPSFTAYDNAAVWQAALTFGVLEAITGRTIPESLLLEKRSDGAVVFTCRNMGALVYHWIYRIFHDGDEGDDRRKHSVDILVCAREALSAACDATHPTILNGLSQLPQNDIDGIICTISLLLDAFYYPVAPSSTGGLFHRPSAPPGYAQRVGDVFLQKMTARGWCPSLRRHLHTSDPQYSWYASSSEPFIRRDQHEHGKCSDTACVVNRTEEATYNTLHTTPGCTCSFLSPSLATLKSALESGIMPVVAYTNGKLIVHAASTGLPYVTISHVWADGLGSTAEKGLPTCQIQRIHGRVRELLGPTAIPAFWIDGLCVSEDKELRNKAVIMMRQACEDAAKVLVVDSSIRALCSSTRPIEENLFRISTSPWMQRVWTLQEAVLARELYFEFSTGIVQAADLLQALCERVSAKSEAWVTPALCVGRNTPIVSVLEPSITGDKPTFLEIVALLYGRSTSKLEDEPLAIAGLFNVSPEKVLSQPDLESRTRALFVEVGTIPRDLIFHDSVCMKKPGFRWCPTSLTSIGRLGSDSPEERAKAICTPDGLVTKGEILVLCLPRIYVLEDMDTHLFVKVTSSGACYNLKKLLDELPKDGSCSVNALLLQCDELLPLPMGQAFHAVAVDVPEADDARDVHVTKDSPLHCEYVMRTDITSCGDTGDFVAQGHPVVEGRLVRIKVTVT